MTNEEAKKLALKLLNSDSEVEAIDVLKAAGFWEKPDAWRLVGDRDGNFATIGSQQSRPEAALVEKIVNSVDARLMNECLVRGLDPTSEDAPPSIRHAVSRFFENREPNGELGGTLQAWSQAKQLEQSQFITLAVTGAMPRSGDPCITIVDSGEGQTPAMIPNTFLSIDRQNKLKILFVQGKFNMGGTGALRFCGHNSLQLIITKRNPAIVSKRKENDPTQSQWGFTIVRRERPIVGAGHVKNSVFSYLAPVGSQSAPNRGNVLVFDADALPLTPDRNKAYAREVLWGSGSVRFFVRRSQMNSSRSSGFSQYERAGTVSSAQSRSDSASSSESTVVLARAINTANEFRSQPTASRPLTSASTTVVPPPMYGSRTRSPGCENASIAAAAN